MGLKKIYTCDLCKEQRVPAQLYGLRFTAGCRFVLGPAESTDGTHICHECTEQLKEQFVEPLRGTHDYP